ncbi:Golgi SNAP receptor complex member 1-2-like [Hibiscus syriacus]|uniref:Golgi SNAP receptor complex member 1-2-like n=1 Tax=Hibiscus syriacus TaxID=106335 RepID=UPI001921EA0C|nr:Golgi SNAP receptor complex member 1-2-like [Hibiscus syriacus]
MELPFNEFDIILGMDWLSPHHGWVDCLMKRLFFKDVEGSKLVVIDEKAKSPSNVISAMTARKMMTKGCITFLANVIDTRVAEVRVDNIPTIREFSNVFPEELPGLPLDREVEFQIEVYPGSPKERLSSPTVCSSRSWKSMEMEIQSLLEKLLDTNDSMSRCAASAASTASVTQKLARHRDILHEFTQEFRRIKGNINSMREHAELLSSVRDNNNEYKASGSMSPRIQLLRERAAIHGSIAHIDGVINQAQSTRAVLGSQRALFGDVQGKIKVLSDKFPVIRGLLCTSMMCLH